MIDDLEKDPMKMLLELGPKIPFFKEMSKPEIKDLVSEAKFLTYNNKEVIFHEGDTKNNYLYFLIVGKLFVSKMSTAVANKKTRIATIDKPMLFGEMMRLTGEPRSATIEAGQDKTLVLAFRVKEFKNLSTISKFYQSVINELSNKIIEMNRKQF